MGNKVLSFEIGAHVTKICVMSYQYMNPKVYQTLVLDTPYDCVEDGYIKDVDSLAGAISKKLNEAKISVGHAVFTISSSKIVNREVILPMVKENKIKDVIYSNAEDYFPIDIKDYNISYFMMEKINTKEIKNYRLLVLAVHNNLLMTYYELAERLKLKVDSIDYIGNSVYQIYQKQVTQETSMVIQINEQNTLINVMKKNVLKKDLLKKNVLELQRVIPYGYDAAINTILENSYYKLSKEEEAFSLLRDKPLLHQNFSNIGYSNNQMEGDATSTQEADAADEVTDSLRYLVNNILRVVEYYSSKKPDAKIQTIYLTGMGAKLRGIELLIKNEIGIDVKVINTLHGVTFTQQIAIENYTQSDFAACVGATIAPVGIRPTIFAIREFHKSNVVSLVTICSLALLTSLLLWIISNQAVNNAEEEKARLSAEIAKLESIDVVYSDNLKLEEELTTIKGLESLCYSSNEELLPLIGELEQKLPSDVTIHSLRSSDSGFLMDLTADSKETAAMALIQLKTISYLTNVTTSGISEQVDENGMTEINFSITASYVMPVQNQEGAQ